MRLVAMGGLLVILGAAVADVPAEHAVAVATGAVVGLLVVTFGPRFYRRG